MKEKRKCNRQRAEEKENVIEKADEKVIFFLQFYSKIIFIDN